MDNTTIPNVSVLRKYLSVLSFDEFRSAYLDWGTKKLTTANLMRICVAIQLGNWGSYAEIEEQIRALNEGAVELFGLTSISGSQLSRRVNDLPSTFAQRLFLAALAKLKEVSLNTKGFPALGILHIVDSSLLHIGADELGKWAYFTKHSNCVKFHTRLVVTAPGEAYPDMVIPSTGNVDDREVALELVIDPDATHLMDRGYVDYSKMDYWVKENIKFAMRINGNNKATILETYQIPSDKNIILDAKVLLGSSFTRMEHPVRLVEFQDQQGRSYRIVTNRWDLTAEEVAELYRCRWAIELFFKWVKQHLRIRKLQSTKPQGIWNQIFFAMTAYCLAWVIRAQEKTSKTVWQVLRLLRIHAKNSWQEFQNELHRPPKRTSKGRQKSQQPRSPVELYDAGVAIVKPIGVSTSKMAKYMKTKKKK